jgi:hypothetical protein
VLIYRVLKIRYDFFARDGSSVSATVMGEGMDSGDKASNKAMAVAHKYALLQILSIPTEESLDTENESHQVAPKPPPQAQGPAKDASKPADPKEDAIRSEIKAEMARFVEIMQAHGPSGEYFTDDDRKLAKSKISMVKGATDENLAYIKTVVNEYQVKLWAKQKPDEPVLF